MEITNYSSKLRAVSGKETKSTERRVDRGGSDSSAQSRTDRVEVSSQARVRGVALAKALETPEIRAEKVNRLREQVRDGTFQPDLRKTAENLVKEDFELII
jgi:negative regulator of flagellin synthesis FlgM